MKFVFSLFLTLSLAAASWSLADDVKQLTIAEAMQMSVNTPYPRKPAGVVGRGDGLYQLEMDTTTGEVRSVKVLKTTGSKVLDAAAIQTFKVWRMKPGGPDLINVPVTFE